MALDEVEVALEHEAASTGGPYANLVARLEPRLRQRLHGKRRLMLRADPREPSTPYPYFFHQK
ncbi:MAG TPA: hypothetical protein VHC01_06900 [Gaiellaceae bacterium]|nr:hypothetical protein [Gaiellaceae bacterium]